MSGWLKENARYVIVAVLVVLVVSLGLHDWFTNYLYNHLQRTNNFMCSEAFQSWLDEIGSVEHVLRSASTNFDVKEALNYTFAAKQFANILDWTIEVLPRPPDFAEHLYFHLASATLILHMGVSEMAATPADALRNLDEDDLLYLGNLTTTFQDLRGLVGTVERTYYGVGPVQWLQERGILAQVIDYIKQIESVSIDIYAKYM